MAAFLKCMFTYTMAFKENKVFTFYHYKTASLKVFGRVCIIN